MITGVYTLDGVEHEYHVVGKTVYDERDNIVNRVWAYPVRQAVLGADYALTLYFSTTEKRDAYLSEHDYCDKLPRCKVPELG